MNARARLTIPCVAVLAAGLAFASGAQAGWSRPTTVALAPDRPALVAASAKAGATVAWRGQRTGRITARRIGPRGLLGPVKSLSAPLTDALASPRIAVAASGATVIVWSVWRGDINAGNGSSTLFARRMSARGKLGPIRTIAHEPDAEDDGSMGQQVAMDAAGNATIVWSRIVSTGPVLPHGGYTAVSASVRMRRLDADGSLGPTVEIAAGGGLDVAPTLAVDRSGRAVVAWSRSAADRYSVRAVLLDRDGGLGPIQEVSTPGMYGVGRATVAIDRDGRATVTWVAPDVVAGLSGVAARQLSTRGLGSLHLLSEGSLPFGPVVATDAPVAATVAWRQVAGPDENFVNRALARQVRLGGGVGPLRVLGSGKEVSDPVVAADRHGNTTVLWTQSPFALTGSVKARRISRSGRLGRLRSLGKKGADATGPAVAADARGVVTAIWSADGFLQVSRYVPRGALP